MRHYFLFLALISFSVAGGYLIGQQSNVPVNAQKSSTENQKIFELLGKIQAEKISEIKFWGSNGKVFYCVVREVEEPPTDDSMFKTSDKLSIYDKSGKIVYETKDFGLGNLENVRFLKSDESEIMFSTNGGGTDDFLNILSYQNGQFTAILDDENGQFRGGYFTMLQYRKGMQIPYSKPSQLIVIQQQGGADDNPTAVVLRTKNTTFQKVGEIKMQELGDFIEKQIAQNK